jgi:hypothetical protein
MKRKFLSVLLAACFCTACFVPAASAEQAILPSSALSSLANNCPDTGIMIPAEFDPFVVTYLLTVASWVSRVILTPVSVDPQATIDVNGSRISSGQPSQDIIMTDEPQVVTISVTSSNMDIYVYNVFLQRRPSTERTRVSAGYLSEIQVDNGKTYLVMDLVTVDYADGNAVSFSNDAAPDQFTYPVTDECIFYYGPAENPIRANDLADFEAHVTPGGGELYQIVYIEDEIVIVLPFAYGLTPTP